MTESPARDAPDYRLQAALLASAFPILMIGGAFWRLEFQGPSLADVLAAVHRNRLLWMWIHAWLGIGMIVGALGYASLREVLRERGDTTFAPLGLTLFLIGLGPFLVAMILRTTLQTDAAAATVAGEMPALYPAFHLAMGAMHGVHMLLAYLAAVCFGAGLVRTRLLRASWGRSGVIFGAFGAVMLLVAPGAAGAPLLALVYPFALGIGLWRANRG